MFPYFLSLGSGSLPSPPGSNSRLDTSYLARFWLRSIRNFDEQFARRSPPGDIDLGLSDSFCGKWVFFVNVVLRSAHFLSCPILLVSTWDVPAQPNAYNPVEDALCYHPPVRVDRNRVRNTTRTHLEYTLLCPVENHLCVRRKRLGRIDECVHGRSCDFE